MKKTIGIFVLTIIIGNVNAQRVLDVSMSYGVDAMSALDFNNNELSNLYGSSDVFNLSDLANQSASYINGNSVFGMQLGMRVGKKRKGFKQNLRIGFLYSASKNYFSVYKGESNAFRYDTLTSTTNEEFYVDSIHYKYNDLNSSMNLFSLDANYIVRLNENSRFHPYFGIGASLGVSLQNKTRINSTESSYVNYPNPIGSFYVAHNASAFESEIINNSIATVFSPYIPIGLNFRLSNKNAKLSRLNLYYEARPNFQILSSGDFDTQITTGLTQQLGVRFALRPQGDY